MNIPHARTFCLELLLIISEFAEYEQRHSLHFAKYTVENLNFEGFLIIHYTWDYWVSA
jgi:hypothetical protein